MRKMQMQNLAPSNVDKKKQASTTRVSMTMKKDVGVKKTLH
jgi:hypothetical protein